MIGIWGVIFGLKKDFFILKVMEVLKLLLLVNCLRILVFVVLKVLWFDIYLVKGGEGFLLGVW